LILKFALEISIRKVQTKQDGLNLSGTHQLLFRAGIVNVLGGSIYNTKNTIKTFAIASKKRLPSPVMSLV